MKQIRKFVQAPKPVTKVCLSLDTVITDGIDAGFTSGSPLSIQTGEVLVVTTNGVWKGKESELQGA